MTKPRLAILHYSAPPIIGGVESTIAAHARLLADDDYAVKVLAGRGESFDPRVPVQLIPLLDSRHSFVLRVNEKLAHGLVPTDFFTLAQAIENILVHALADVDICIAHNVVTLHKNLALTAILREMVERHRLRLIAWSHDFAWEDPLYAAELHAGLPWDLLRQAWRGVKYVVVSEARRRELARLLNLNPAEIAVIPPGLDPHEFLGTTATTTCWLRDLSLLDAAPLLLLPARVTRRKNIELAIRITAALRAQGLAPKLVVMGPLGPHNPANSVYLNELLDLQRSCGAGDAIVFLQQYGTVDDATRRDLYLLADALLFTSEREGFGIPILEAGLTRLPIFCSDIAPFSESAGKWACYFGLDESPAAIAERIAGTLARDARYQMKHRVLNAYSWRRILTQQIEPLLEQV